MQAITNLSRAWLSAILATALAHNAIASPATVTIVVPFSAGGPTDRIAHDFAKAAKRHAPHQTFIIENVGGAGGTLGAAKVAKAPADGSVLLLQNIALSAAPALNKTLPYSTLDDFEYIGMLQSVPMVLVARTGLPASFSDFKRLSHLNAGFRLAHAGIGSASHLCGLLIQRALGSKFTEKTYAGNAPATADLLAGNVDLLCDATNSASKQIDAGAVRAYGISDERRLVAPNLKAIPTLAEQGLKEAEIAVWFGLGAPKGTPQVELDRYNALLRAVVADAEFAMQQEAAGAVVTRDARLAPSAYKRFVASQIDHWGEYLTPAPLSAKN